MAVTRSSTATYVIPSENEWYKAAYYDPTLSGGTGGYWAFATKSNTKPGNTLPDTTGNNANCYVSNYADPTNLLTPVGDFVLSPSAYGTFDQTGDAYNRNETAISGSYRVNRGGWYADYMRLDLTSSSREDAVPTNFDYGTGFRVASSAPVPEPTSIALLLAVAVALGIWRLRRKA